MAGSARSAGSPDKVGELVLVTPSGDGSGRVLESAGSIICGSLESGS